MNQSEKHKVFKAEARNYDFYQGNIKNLNEKLETLQHQIENVHSVPTDQERMDGTRTERPIIKMLERKAQMEEQRSYYQSRIEWIHKVIDNIASPAYKAVAWKTFIQRKSLREFAAKYDVSPDHVYRVRKYFIEHAINEELAKEYENIVNPLGTFNDDEDEYDEFAPFMEDLKPLKTAHERAAEEAEKEKDLQE